MKPLIIVTPSVSENGEIILNRNYFAAVRRAGGTALVSDYADMESILERACGLLLSGGGDIDPFLTGDIAVKSTQGLICRRRDAFEIELVRRAAELDMPVLGICRGAQVIGAAFGGHIIQHTEGHRGEGGSFVRHNVLVKKGTLLERVCGATEFEVNSCHHQAVGGGSGCVISALAEDGIAEAAELGEKRFVLGVQWHPERLTESAESCNIFLSFIKAAAEYGLENGRV